MGALVSEPPLPAVAISPITPFTLPTGPAQVTAFISSSAGLVASAQRRATGAGQGQLGQGLPGPENTTQRSHSPCRPAFAPALASPTCFPLAYRRGLPPLKVVGEAGCPVQVRWSGLLMASVGARACHCRCVMPWLGRGRGSRVGALCLAVV